MSNRTKITTSFTSTNDYKMSVGPCKSTIYSWETTSRLHFTRSIYSI